MSNMSYCRFRNTVKDLKDCWNAIEDGLDVEEHEARERLVTLCRDIVEAYDNGAVPDDPIEDDPIEEEEDEEEEGDDE